MSTQEEIETLCGIGCFRPRFLQKLASKKLYVCIYGCLSIIQSMMGTYLGAMLSTFEKRFGITSKESAYLISGNEITHALFFLILPFAIKVKRRPLWMALALFISGFGCIMMGMPYLLTEHQFVDFYDETFEKHQLEVHEHPTFLKRNNTYGMCGSEIHPNSIEALCTEEGGRTIDYVGLFLLFCGALLTGTGNCIHEIFGITYLDDNMSHSNAPIWMGLILVLKLNVGPTLGFLLAGACLKIYDDPSKSPGFDETDPKWIGAWWIGPPLIGMLYIVFALPLTLFPQRLPKQNTDSARENAKSSSPDAAPNNVDFKASIQRLLKNKLFMYQIISNYFYAFGFKGFRTFMQKYMETQFRKTASQAAFLGGGGIITFVIGILTSAIVLSKFKPRARLITGWSVVAMTLTVTWMVLFGIIGCPTSNVYGENTKEGININTGCRPEPICLRNGATNFYSPCLAGCKGPIKTRFDHLKDENITIYTKCSCAVEAWERIKMEI